MPQRECSPDCIGQVAVTGQVHLRSLVVCGLWVSWYELQMSCMFGPESAPTMPVSYRCSAWTYSQGPCLLFPLKQCFEGPSGVLWVSFQSFMMWRANAPSLHSVPVCLPGSGLPLLTGRVLGVTVSLLESFRCPQHTALFCSHFDHLWFLCVTVIMIYCFPGT